MSKDQLTTNKKIAILGGGPSALFLLKNLLQSDPCGLDITIFEKGSVLGAGMPYSALGANHEHITNVSANEIPDLPNGVAEWTAHCPTSLLADFNIDISNFNAYKVLPRLFFGSYLSAQFEQLLAKAKSLNVPVHIEYDALVSDIIDYPKLERVGVEINNSQIHKFDQVVVCTGHLWPKHHEEKVKNYFDSPYPPAKLPSYCNHAVAIRGSSLTAIDAIRTLARHHGVFIKDSTGKLVYELAENAEHFKLVMHSRNGLLPAVRFHLEDSHLQQDDLLSNEALQQHLTHNDGFLSLDFLFEHDFMAVLRKKDPAYYEQVKGMKMEEFVAHTMKLREQLDPFVLLKAEYAEAAQSIKRKQSVFWKELLGTLSFALNYPAKYLSAEDMLRLKQHLQPLISVVIAYVPQSSCEELMALHDAGLLEMVSVGDSSEVIPQQEGGIIYRYRDEQGASIEKRYETFVDCIGQPHLDYQDFPFNSLKTSGAVRKAQLRFQSTIAGEEAAKNEQLHVEVGQDGTHYLNVSGLAINDYFQVLDQFGAYSDRIFMMAVPFMGGLNPDYSGLDFCEEASKRISAKICELNLADYILGVEQVPDTEQHVDTKID